MIQNQLFPDDRPPKLARNADPETSHAAAAEVVVKLSRLEDYMLESWIVCGPQTANEAAGHAAMLSTEFLSHETLRKRYTGLLKKGRIKSDGKKRCDITGKLATVYRITENQNDS